MLETNFHKYFFILYGKSIFCFIFSCTQFEKNKTNKKIHFTNNEGMYVGRKAYNTLDMEVYYISALNNSNNNNNNHV